MQQRLVIFVAFVCYWLGLIHLFYKINRNRKRIITFHNVMPTHILPQGEKIGLTDTEDEFRMKIREISRMFRVNTDIFDNKSATITFDDGYLNQAKIAGRILTEENNIPAIIFASGKMIDNDRASDALIVDLLMHWVQLAPDGDYNVRCAYCELNLALTPYNRNETWQKIIWPNFIHDVEAKGYNLLLSLDKVFPVSKILSSCDSEYLKLRLTGITSQDMHNLESNGWTIGWHTQEHFPLSMLSHKDKLREISLLAPKQMKRNVFSYPYGEFNSVDKDCLKIVREAGYPCAVSNLIPCSDIANNFFLPRMTLSSNRYVLHFELSGMKYFIQHRKRLPLVKFSYNN